MTPALAVHGRYALHQRQRSFTEEDSIKDQRPPIMSPVNGVPSLH